MLDYLSIINDEKINKFVENFNKKIPQSIFGLNEKQKGFFMGLVNQQAVFVCRDIANVSKILKQLNSMGKTTDFIASGYENTLGLSDNFLKYDFMASVSKFAHKQTDVLFVTVESLFQKCPSIKDLQKNYLELENDKDYSFQSLSQKLAEMGFERVEYISHKGQFSIRGDIIEIFPIDKQNIFRINFFDTQVEKIVEIDDEKKIIKKYEKIKIFAINYNLNQNNLLNLAEYVFFDEPQRLEDLKKDFENSDDFYKNQDIFKTNACGVAFKNISTKTFFVEKDLVVFEPIIVKNYVYNILDISNDIDYYQSQNKNIYLFCGNKENKKNIKKILENSKIIKINSKINILEDFFPFSIYFKSSNSVLIGTEDLFKQKKEISKKTKSKTFIPQVGDYVVHTVHGIGKCVAIEKMNFSNFEKDYFVIEYAGGDRFYLPSEQADDITAFTFNDEPPKLNKLGGVEFAKIKSGVYKKVKELAFDLLKLYAEREKAKGNVYVKDDYLMETFEDAFPYEETDDQLRAISDIKNDMESEKIMDRLICGDVGFGKTEVAFRAIYKAVLSGKQVAFLCPTTILAEQHYKTCLKRFSGFMVHLARFDRLVPLKEQKQTLQGLASGNIDVVCGTHKLLGKDVVFKNLSLLVLDEEQRFGVEDKEKIKNLKKNIDVLTLSATPIPRTLHMSLTGIRDISLIETPPQKRLPVQTFVAPLTDELIVRACKQELARGGQVFIVYNRVESIYNFAKHIEMLLPDVSIGVAHGQLKPKELEDTILNLYSGKYQILIATTLIENGVDLPIANTLIVVESDRLGLSALYQLRGRIGRGDRLAYAYFTYNGEKSLTDSAYKRLNAIIEYSGLGSGYKIAMTDLAIRGAGNVLGREQSGNIMKVGYDMYYKLLDDALKEIKGEKIDEFKEIKMDINLNAYIPESYISKESERIEKYNQISKLKTNDEMKEFEKNLENVYGKIPNELQNLIKIAYLKNLAKKHEVRRILISELDRKIYYYNGKYEDLGTSGTISEKLDYALKLFQTSASTS